MSQGFYNPGHQQQSFGSAAYSGGGSSASGSQHTPFSSVQYSSGGQPVPGAMVMQGPPGTMVMAPQMNPAFVGHQSSMGGHPQFVPVAPGSGYAPAGAVYAPGAGGPAFERSSTGDYGQVPQMPKKQQQQQQQQSPQQQSQQQQQPPQRFVVPPGMTRESMQPGYGQGLGNQPNVFDPQWSFRDSFGMKRNNCCTIS